MLSSPRWRVPPLRPLTYLFEYRATGERCRMCNEGKAKESCPVESTLSREEHAGHVSLPLAKDKGASSARGSRGARRCRGNARVIRTRGTLETCSDGLCYLRRRSICFVGRPSYFLPVAREPRKRVAAERRVRNSRAPRDAIGRATVTRRPPCIRHPIRRRVF